MRDDVKNLLPPDVDQLKELDFLKWQTSVVDSVCAKLKIPTSDRQLMRTWDREQGGQGYLTFEALHEVLDGFPMFFAAKLIPNLGKLCPVSLMFTRFDRTPIYKQYVKWKEDVPETATAKPFGLLFRWPNMLKTGDTPRDGCMVLHDRKPVEAVSGTRLMWILNPASNPSSKIKDVTKLYLTPLRVLLQELIADGAWDCG